jgi:predicted DNA-binding transcriptional regulator AlpA
MIQTAQPEPASQAETVPPAAPVLPPDDRRQARLRLADLRTVASLVAMCPRTVMRQVVAGAFPAPMRIGTGKKRLLRWTFVSLESWLRDQQAAAAIGQTPAVDRRETSSTDGPLDDNR